MRVWIIDQYAKTPDQSGGVRQYSLGRRLVEKGHEVKIFCARDDPRWGKTGSANPHRTDFDGVQVARVDALNYQGNGLRRVFNMLHFSFSILFLGWREEQARPDVIIGSSPHLFGALVGKVLASHHNVPFVLEVRDLWPDSFIEIVGMSRRHPLVLMLSILEGYVYRKSAGIVTLLSASAEHFRKRGAGATPIVCIPNGADLAHWPKPTPPPEDDIFTVLYVGSHGVSNGLELLLSTAECLRMRNVKDVRIQLLGDGPERTRLIQAARSSGLENIRFESPIPREEVPERMSRADALFIRVPDHALYRHGISMNKLFDYMAAARPIILASNGSFPNLVDSGAFLQSNENPQDLTSAILSLRDMTLSERVRMGTCGRIRVEESNSYEHLATLLESFLEVVIQSQSKGRLDRGS